MAWPDREIKGGTTIVTICGIAFYWTLVLRVLGFEYLFDFVFSHLETWPLLRHNESSQIRFQSEEI